MFRKLLALLSDSAVYGVSSMLNRIVGLLVLWVLTDYLTVEDFGIINVLGIVIAVFGPLGNLGMSNAIFRRFSVEKERDARARIMSTGLVSTTIASLVVLALGMVFAYPLMMTLLGQQSIELLGAAQSVNLVRLSLLTAVATTIGMVPFSALRARRRVKTAATINLLKVMISFGATIYLVVVHGTGVWGAVVGPLVGEVIMLVVQLALTLREYIGRFDRATWKAMFKYGLPYVPHQLQAVGLDLFGVYVIREMMGLQAAGLYGVASRFASPVTFVVNSVHASWVPYKFEMHATEEDARPFFRSAFTYYIAGISYLWLGVTLWGPEGVRLLTTPNFHPAAMLVWAVALVPVAQGLYYMSGTGLELTDNTKSMPLVSLSGLIVTVATTYLLVDRFGAGGAALATTSGWMMMGFVLYHLSQRRFPIAYDWKTVVAFGILAAICGAAGVMLQDHAWPLRVAYALLISLLFPLVGLAILLRSGDERQRMLHLLKKMRLGRSGGKGPPTVDESPVSETPTTKSLVTDTPPVATAERK